MMKVLFTAFALAPIVIVASTAQTATKHPASTSHNSKSTSAKSSAHTRTHRTVAKKTPRPSYQLHPSQERYGEIQQALAEKGYFKGTVDGKWSDDSVDALKRFQTDNKIDSDGKINSLSLIQLGLGPKHDGSSITTVDPVAPQPPPPPVSEASPENPQSTQ
jgi:peptidoglycan hydrolase-like protein with peptidoglycan-binding domain